MSLDLYIEDESFNYTYNVAEMWYKVFPDDKGMVYIDGMTGDRAFEKINKAFNYLIKNRKDMLKLEPGNGWGSHQGFLYFLMDLMIACMRYPNSVWSSCR